MFHGRYHLVTTDDRYAKAHLELRWVVLRLESAAGTTRDLAFTDTDPFETLAAVRDHALRMARRLTDFIDENQPR